MVADNAFLPLLMNFYKADMYIYFETIKAPILLDNCPELLAFIKKNLSGWAIRLSSKADPKYSPIITIRKTPKGYVRLSNWLEQPKTFKHPVDAVCDFLVDLMKAYLDENENLLCLHCAAVKFGSNLFLFPSTYSAGKSSLAVALAMEGATIFSEDVLPLDIETGACIASGIHVRLRNPLPDDFSDEFTEFISVHTSSESKKFRYLNLPENSVAPLGTRGEISKIYVIERAPDIDGLKEEIITDSEILKLILLRNFSHANSADNTLTFFLNLIQNIECWKLKYSTTEVAAAYLKEKLSAPSLTQFKDITKAQSKEESPKVFSKDISGQTGQLYQQATGISERLVGDSIFLVGLENETLYCLEGLSGPIWQILEEPINISDIILLICEAFPKIPAELIKQDVERLFHDLKARDLVFATENRVSPSLLS